LVSDNCGTAAASCTDGTAVEVGEEGTADRVALPFKAGSADSEVGLLAKLPPRAEKQYLLLSELGQKRVIN
jgi:hypothetical protein